MLSSSRNRRLILQISVLSHPAQALPSQVSKAFRWSLRREYPFPDQRLILPTLHLHQILEKSAFPACWADQTYCESAVLDTFSTLSRGRLPKLLLYHLQ